MRRQKNIPKERTGQNFRKRTKWNGDKKSTRYRVQTLNIRMLN